MILSKMRQDRRGLWMLVFITLITIATLTRVALLIKSSAEVDFTGKNLTGIFLLGFLFDFATALYFTFPLVLYLWLMPDRVHKRKGHRYTLYIWVGVFSFMAIFSGVSEWLFWDEFNVRFNFIAVDYLVYTTEVIGNISQSYPITWIIIVIGLLSLSVVMFSKSAIETSGTHFIPFKKRTQYMALYLTVLFFSLFIMSAKQHRFSKNEYVNELAGNGVYELFASYRNNELSYDQFYRRLDVSNAFGILHKILKTPEAQFISNDEFSIVRTILNPGPEHKLNVVLISVESFSADFMKHFGSTESITPFLDSLCQHSLLFTNLYATGTRTVRGLEALSLCVPPTPGQSIVRRPANENLFSLGKVFESKGYASEYIYGGYSYFDNMGNFFGRNHYKVVDRSALRDDEIAYENIWGVADENLFDLALHELDNNCKSKPTFAHVMTTSNHRPFTYPDGRIDIPSHTSRSGAVKYTDYAIGRFIRQASTRPWFTNTVFVIVADHCASSAGKTELPVSKYHIPMLMYSPGNILPGEMNRLMSQIDVGPTLLGMLNFSYTSNFYGYDMFKLEPGRERAFISTYQSLGYLHNGKLVILSPQGKVESMRLSDKQDPGEHITDSTLVNEAIAWYQTASYSYRHGMMK